jgi:hypothetical protein
LGSVAAGFGVPFVVMQAIPPFSRLRPDDGLSWEARSVQSGLASAPAMPLPVQTLRLQPGTYTSSGRRSMASAAHDGPPCGAIGEGWLELKCATVRLRLTTLRA